MKDQLPAWLNPYQLMAWLRYRDAALAQKTETATQLAALTFYDDREIIAGEEEVATALQEGRLTAYGAKAEEDFAPIPPIEWTRFRVAPQNPKRLWPYVAVQFPSSDVQAQFPSPAEQGDVQISSNVKPITAKKSAEVHCRAWLCEAFEKDEKQSRTKTSFKKEALEKFHPNLSERGFLRVWAAIAPDAGRSMPGRKS